LKLITKYQISLTVSLIFCLLSLFINRLWVDDIAEVVGTFFAYTIVIGISTVPSIILSFINFSLIIDDRPKFNLDDYPPITILISAYNEEVCIYRTLETIFRQNYKNLYVIVINDGSKDNTSKMVNHFITDDKTDRILFLDNKINRGKSRALNMGLKKVKTEYCLTIDADSLLHKNALKNIVKTIVCSDENYAAVAGSILCKNFRIGAITKYQYWDYLIGISSIKRIQSMFQGTLVAQGAFSIYRTDLLRQIGGWPDSVGEDIVMTWKLLKEGHKIGHAEDAICFTNTPEDYKTFFNQRVRWARGMIEAFRAVPELILRKRKSTFFIINNLLFPLLDSVYLFVFVPGVLAAIFFQYYLIAGIMTLLQIPLAFIFNFTVVKVQQKTLSEQGIKIPKRLWPSFFGYMLFYQLLMTPACITGYYKELTNKKKTW